MPISIEMAKVAGTFRCNRWSEFLEGGEPPADDTAVITLADLLEQTRQAARQARSQLKKRRRARKRACK